MAIPLSLLAAGAGCSGINASHSVSPLDFLLPGIGGFGQSQRPVDTNALVQSSFTPSTPTVLLVQAK
ncbi:MAG: hypothetical protein HZA89_09090 [Verrucomicrobia bacterium]|nr:hypothetical protein [Verrucomicrobiota bacterium]